MSRTESNTFPTPDDPSGTALILAAHGSLLNDQSDVPAFQHADTVRRTGIFDEVREAFWKEEPTFRNVLRGLKSDTVFVVPLFISEGYFVDQVLPRELRITGPDAPDVKKFVHLTEPIGTHPSLGDVIVHRAEEACDEKALADRSLVLIGHGTKRNPKSKRSILNHADRLRHRNRFRDVSTVFLEESPTVDQTVNVAATDHVIAVPMFISDGFHTDGEIPEEIGVIENASETVERGTAVSIEGKQVRYTAAVGTDPLVASVVLERAKEQGAPVQNSVPFPRPGTMSAPSVKDSSMNQQRSYG